MKRPTVVDSFCFIAVKVIPSMAVQHFFILFEVLRSLYADVDPGECVVLVLYRLYLYLLSSL